MQIQRADGSVLYGISKVRHRGGNMPIVMTYGFDWQEGRQVGDAFYEECAKTVTTTKAGGVLIVTNRGEENEELMERRTDSTDAFCTQCRGGRSGCLIKKISTQY